MVILIHIKVLGGDMSLNRDKDFINKARQFNKQSKSTDGINSSCGETHKTLCLNSKGGRNGIDGLQPSLSDRIYDSNGVATACATSSFFMPNYLIHNER